MSFISRVEKSRNSLRAKLLLISLLFLALSLNAHPGQYLPMFQTAHAQAAPKVAVDPQRIADFSITPGSTVEFVVNLTDAPAINGFSVILTYNTRVLDALTLESTGNVLGAGAYPVRNCVDGVVPPGIGCQPFPDDGPGVVSLSLLILGGLTTPPTNGLLFRVTFSVIDLGLSQIEIKSAVLSTGRQVNGEPEQIPVSTSDGHFTNIDCPDGSGTLCTPPTPVFTWSPMVLVQGRLVTFNASSSLPSAGATITEYFWEWGDGKAPVGPTDKNSTVHVFDTEGRWSVTLRITDSNLISWKKTEFVTVINTIIDLAIVDVTASKNQNVLPGTPIAIKAEVRNAGFGPQNATLRISLEGSALGETTFLNLSPQAARSLELTWNTTNYAPRVYRIDAFTPLVRNSTTGLVVENATANNARSTWIQLIEPLPAGLAPGLLASTGLGIVVLTGVLFAVSRARRRPSIEGMTMLTP